MKPSCYNYVFSLTNDTFLYFNFFTLSLLALDERSSLLARTFLEDPQKGCESDEEIALRRLLVKKGFLIEDSCDEVGLLRQAYQASCRQKKNLSLTVAPTLACNFRCIYCYQQGSMQSMSGEVEESLVRFIDARVPEGGKLSIIWFGGEPLLRLDQISRLSTAFLRTCERKRADYKARIITNGYLMDEQTTKILIDFNITSAQVTVDGPSQIHNQRRVLKKSTRETFSRIFANILQAADQMDITIRMNVDEGNREYIPAFVRFLVQEGVEKKVGFYLGRTYPYSSACADIAGQCLDNLDFSLLELETLLLLNDYGFSRAYRLPKAKNHYCTVDNQNSFVITPTGSIVNCWNEIDNPEAEVAHLQNVGNGAIAKDSERWRIRDPFGLECASCMLLPICMGGCPYYYRITGRPDCHKWKYHLNENLAFYYYFKSRQRKNKIFSQLNKAYQAAHRIRSALGQDSELGR